MPKIHVLTGNLTNSYTCVVHADTPAGNNSAGMAWADCIKNSGRNTTILAVGTGPGQITNTEQNAIVNGTVIEAVFGFFDDINMNTAQRLAALDAVATQSVNSLIQQYQTELKYYGLTRN